MIDDEILPKPQAIKRQKAEATVYEIDHSEMFLKMLGQQLNEKNSQSNSKFW
jgi:hypothetical protein